MGLTIGPKIITENLVLHFDSGNPLGWNNTTGEWHNFASNTVGGTRNSTNITYNSSEDALFFPNAQNSDGLVINDINYVTGASDQVSNLTLEAWVKVSSGTTTHTNDQRIILHMIEVPYIDLVLEMMGILQQVVKFHLALRQQMERLIYMLQLVQI